MLKNDDFVIAKNQLGNIVPNSVGVIRTINGKTAIVLFIGLNEVNYPTAKAIGLFLASSLHN